ncbi:hypothetical protein UFOVP595_24 [uncultured Caudovirales phage]|jgi:hypothetical protein|uniref:Uncharacterized protein n=1 Tax=uncultured Caudovirales phage TaxID=2100421 RepID=A0A6J5N0L5_9CAUD|nr:hypothetical protein UFOVP595_24 [uncultured Caudovirales phage]
MKVVINQIETMHEIKMSIEDMISHEDQMQSMSKIIDAIGNKKITQANFYFLVNLWSDKCHSIRKFQNQ